MIRDCLNQFSGKERCFVAPEVYRSLEEEFRKHNLLILCSEEGNPTSPSDHRAKFANITKDHVSIFLHVLHCTKHYKNVNLIHRVMTGKPGNNISHLEQQLMDDFITLTDLYDKRYKQDGRIARKNFINTQYVLFQLLKRHKFPCSKEDFNILKTVDRRNFHDSVTKELFEELGWNMVFLI